MANMTHRAGRPTESPRMRGPRMLPSICCRIRMKIPNSTALYGLMISRMKMHGIAPRNGPNTGIIFVKPTTKAISGVYGICMIPQTMPQAMPIISESSALPKMKLFSIRMVSLPT